MSDNALIEIRRIAAGQSKHVSDAGRLITIERIAASMLAARGAPQLPFEEASPPAFDGGTFEAAVDLVRLSGQSLRVWDCLQDGAWRTLAEIHIEIARVHGDRVRDSEAGISARLRDFRKARFGAHTIERRRRDPDGGLHEYRLTVNPAVRMLPLDGSEASAGPSHLSTDASTT